jgi:hypothetical protein
MADVNVVTSCSRQGWDQYGARFVETFRQYWPKTVDLHVVSEDELPMSPQDSEVVWNLNTWAAARKFLEANADILWKHGHGACKRPDGVARHWQDRSGHSFRFDAYKFSKKVFAIELVANNLEGGRLYWVDADVRSFELVPYDLMVRMLPNDYALSCLARPGYHSECGFVGYNLEQQAARNFIAAFSALYTTEAVFTLAEWHDSWVFDYLRNKLMTKTFEIPHKSKGHPFINSELGKYMDHLKGKRKDKGTSQKVEQIAHRNVEYWK